MHIRGPSPRLEQDVVQLGESANPRCSAVENPAARHPFAVDRLTRAVADKMAIMRRAFEVVATRVKTSHNTALSGRPSTGKPSSVEFG